MVGLAFAQWYVRATAARSTMLISCATDDEIAGLDVSHAFFRAESRVSRDLAVLIASAHFPTQDDLLIIDACAGAGTRAIRYARDLRHPHRAKIIANEPHEHSGLAANALPYGIEVRHQDAHRFLESFGGTASVVDVDSFGLSLDVSVAVRACTDGGVVWLTTTGAAAAGAGGPAGRRACLARLGARSDKLPGSQNELGLRMLLGRAAAAAAADSASLTPLVSLYAAHGPVFRIAARIDRARPDRELFHRNYRFLASCAHCHSIVPVNWDDLVQPACHVCCSQHSIDSIVGPLWTGRLYDALTLHRAKLDALRRGWLQPNLPSGRALNSTLSLTMAEAADPRLDDVPLARSLDYIARLAAVPTPPLQPVIAALKARGFAAAPTHIDRKALRTTAPVSTCCDIAASLMRHSP